jgi:Protein of unknown function (DUF2789)
MNKPMHPPPHFFSDLFAQLGLPNDEYAIQRFIASHARLSSDFLLAEAPFWTPAQAAFLREAILQDSDWVEMVDQLSVALREVKK